MENRKENLTMEEMIREGMAPLSHWIEVAKKITKEYAKTHKGRSQREKDCIKKGYAIFSLYEIDPDKYCHEYDKEKSLYALYKSKGNNPNWYPIKRLGYTASMLKDK